MRPSVGQDRVKAVPRIRCVLLMPRERICRAGVPDFVCCTGKFLAIETKAGKTMPPLKS